MKLGLLLAFILSVSLAPLGVWPVYLLLLAISLSVVIVSELGVGRVLRRSALALPFMVAALPVVFTAGGTVLATIPLGFGHLTVFQDGLVRFASIAVKSWLSVQMAVLLASTTSFPDLLGAMRALHLPRLLVAVFGLMWRYLFVMADEAGRLMRARASRSGALKESDRRTGGSIAWRARVTGGMAGNLFVRSFERGDRIYDAMRARGYDGEVRALRSGPVPASGWVTLAAGIALLGALLALAYLLQG